jgi:hypothetical protein
MAPTSIPARHFSRPPTPGRSSRRRVLACLLMTAAAFAVSSAFALEGEQKPAAKTNPGAAAKSNPESAAKGKPARPGADGAKSAVAAIGAATANGDLLQRRRAEIARMLEGHLVYRGGILGDGAKLLGPKIAGPFERTRRRSLFSSTITPETLYCVSAEVVLPLRVVADTLVIIEKTADGREKFEGKIYITKVPQECLHADFKPFPEMEQLRAKRRLSMGKTD